MTRNGTIMIRTEGERLGMVRKGAVATSMVVRAVVGLNTQYAILIVVLLLYAPRAPFVLPCHAIAAIT